MTVDHHISAVRVGRDNRHDWGFPVHPEPWMLDGLCAQADPDAWFPDKGVPNKPAKRVCRNCPVLDECLEYALAHGEEFGVWGGLSAMQRRRLLKRRGDAAAVEQLRQALEAS